MSDQSKLTEHNSIKLTPPLPEDVAYVRELLEWQERSYQPEAMIGGENP